MTETTAAPAFDPQIESLLSTLRQRLEGQSSVSASTVQDALLDLWSAVPDGDTRRALEAWLSETSDRSLYATEDVRDRLKSLFA